MKVFNSGIRIAVAALSLAAAVTATSAGTKDCDRVVVTGHPNYAPVSFAVGSSLDGGAIALVRRLAQDAGIPVTVLNAGSWEAAQAATADGTADIIVGIYRTPEREKTLQYVLPAMADDPSSVITRPDVNLAYKKWSSLVGKKGLVSDGESYGPKFDAFMAKRLTVEKVKGFPALFAALESGAGDYGLIGYYAALTGAPKDKVKIAVKSFVSEPMYIAFGRKSACRNLEPAFRRGMKAAVRDGTVDRLWKIGLSDFEQAK